MTNGHDYKRRDVYDEQNYSDKAVDTIFLVLTTRT